MADNTITGVYRTGNDIYSQSGSSIDQATFQSLGLNVNFIPTSGSVVSLDQARTGTNTTQNVAPGSTGYYNPNIAVNQITPTNPFQLAPTQTNPDYRAITAGTNGSLPPPPNPEQDALNANQKAITDKLTELGGQEQYFQQQQEASGSNANKKAIIDMQSQLAALNNEALAETVKIGNQPILGSIAQGQASQVEKLRAIKAMGISSQIQAMQGNLQLANDQAERAVKLKYDPIRAQLEILDRQLDYNYKRFDAAERKRADALKEENALRMRQLDIEEANERDKNATLLNQMQSYPDAGITLSDTIESANQKITTRSKIYADKVRGPVNPDGITNESAAVNLYSSMLSDQLGQGRTPEQAVQVAVAAADALGTSLSLKDQNALLTFAKGYKAPVVTSPTTTTSTSTTNKIEARIAQLKAQGTTDNYVARTILSREFSKAQIDASSVGGAEGTLNTVVSGISSFFKGLF